MAPGPQTMDDIKSVTGDLKDIEREVRDFRIDVGRATNDQNQKIHQVELEVKGASGKLDLIFLAQTDHETRIRSVEKAVGKFTVWAAVLGAALSIAVTQIARKFFDDATKRPPAMVDQYLEQGRRKIEEIRRDNEAYLNRGQQHDGE